MIVSIFDLSASGLCAQYALTALPRNGAKNYKSSICKVAIVLSVTHLSSVYFSALSNLSEG